MATLSSALNYALSGLSVTGSQSALVSRNVSHASDENYTRKSAQIIALPGGAVAISSYSRNMDKQLLDKLLSASSTAAGGQIISEAMTRIGMAVGDPETESSLAALIGKLQAEMRLYEANPSNATLGASVLEAARSLAEQLNGISAEVTSIRSQADGEMAQSVERINTLLSQFKVANDMVVRGSGTAMDLTDSLDQRDRILKLLAEETGIRTATRPNNDVLIYAEGGAVLFEGVPRRVTFKASPVYGPETVGAAVHVDGVPVTGAAAVMPVSSGKLAALSKVRDELAITFQFQLDEVAAGLIRGFAEVGNPSLPPLPEKAGLFLDPDGGIPVEGSASTGLAARLSINPLADPSQGGNPAMIRDGGFGGPAYVYNTSGAAGYQDRIGVLIASLDRPGNFDGRSGLGASTSLKSFSVQSAAWVESQRQAAQSVSDVSSATKARAAESLLRVTGVNIDQEMAALLDLEKSYQASSKIISVVDTMLARLFEAVG